MAIVYGPHAEARSLGFINLTQERHAFRARPFTEFMRMVRNELKGRYGDAMPLSARVGNTFERAMMEGADLETWIGEGLVDLLVLQHRDPGHLQCFLRPAR